MASWKTPCIWILLLGIGLPVLSFQSPPVPKKTNEETFDYKLKLGWFTLGSGKVKITYDAFKVGAKSYHQVYAYTTTLGLGNWLSNLDDEYSSMVDKNTAQAYYSYKNVTVKGGRWEQWNDFNYDSLKVKVRVKDTRKEVPELNWHVEIKPNTYDILGTFIYFKNYDWDKLDAKDTVMINTFYEKELYRVGLHYMGRETIELNDQDVEAHRVHLLIPEQEKLKQDRPVVIWLSADENHYPLRIESRLFIGYARCDLATINGTEPQFAP